ncbi:nucleotidyltransferase domain-containing protein [Mycobacterium riyadhense]|uniref:nucleotidyltransferase domain-containing protein n=1 Tax=Mycobacterium riyadhense TaxID=486698 RepID=UPI001EF9CDA5|nr:nucleotidyltransferase domain-containing protein [Mycobacterium riyadhense]
MAIPALGEAECCTHGQYVQRSPCIAADSPNEFECSRGEGSLSGRLRRFVAGVALYGDSADDERIPHMTDVATRTAEAVEMLQRHGAVFAYLHGSRATGTARQTSDIDIAAYFGVRPPQAFELLLPSGVDLLVLDEAPLEIAGRVALHGSLLFETDRQARVVWEATTRKIYLDELPRINRAHREFADAVRRGR